MKSHISFLDLVTLVKGGKTFFAHYLRLLCLTGGLTDIVCNKHEQMFKGQPQAISNLICSLGKSSIDAVIKVNFTHVQSIVQFKSKMFLIVVF